MKSTRTTHQANLENLPRMPSWVTSGRAKTLEDVAFLSGAALAALHLVLGREEVRDKIVLNNHPRFEYVPIWLNSHT